MIVHSSTLLGYDREGKPLYGDTTVIGSTEMTDTSSTPAANLFNVVEARIVGITATLLAVEPHKITRTSSFESLGADSLDHVEIVLELEDEFEIEITDAEAERTKTLDQAFKLVESKL